MIKIGTCGFSFKDWIGAVYPKNIKNRDMLEYYVNHFDMDMVEIDVSYYTLVAIKTVQGWVDRTPEDFLFAVKCHKGMTLNDKKPVDPDVVENEELFKSFLATFRPIIDSDKLLTFLAQFGPVFFKNRKNLDYLKRFRDRFEDLPLTVEFRHKSWLGGENRKSTFDFLKKNNLGYAVVDEPRLRTLAPFVPGVTSDISYFRLHGRSKKWFTGGAEKRYDYFYNDDELLEFIPFIRELERKSKITSVFFNNCHAGAALKNAVKLKQLMGLVKHREQSKPQQLELPF